MRKVNNDIDLFELNLVPSSDEMFFNSLKAVVKSNIFKEVLFKINEEIEYNSNELKRTFVIIDVQRAELDSRISAEIHYQEFSYSMLASVLSYIYKKNGYKVIIKDEFKLYISWGFCDIMLEDFIIEGRCIE